MRQLCRQTGLPVPRSRLKAVSRALKARAESSLDRLSTLEELVDMLLKEVLKLYVNILCVSPTREDVELAEGDAYDFVQRLDGVDPERVRKVLDGSGFLERLSGYCLLWEDEELPPESLEMKRKWTRVLRKHGLGTGHLP